MGSDTKRLVLMACLALWALMWGWSVAAFVAWVLGRDWPKGSGVRQWSRVPIQLALGLAAVLGGLALWAALAG
jgi:hypothetical protein